MFRFCGALLILSGGLITRHTLISGTRGAQRTRRALADALDSMEREIQTLLTPLPELLMRRCEAETASFFQAAARGMAAGQTLRESWLHAAELLPLPEEERARFAALGARLSGDGAAVCAALRLASSELREQYREGERERNAQERLVTALCVGLSILLFILLA